MQAHQRFAARNGIAAHRSPRFPNMRDRKIVIYRTEYAQDEETFEFERNGEPEALVIGCEPDQWEHFGGHYTAAHVAAKHLRDHYYVWKDDASAYPFQPGSWYGTTEEELHLGQRTETTFHLHGFTPSEEVRIHRALHG